MHRPLPLWLAAIVAAIAALVVPAVASAQVSGGVGFRVDQQPGSTMEAGYLTVVAAPGTTGSGYFFMTNSGASTAKVRVYTADGLTGVTTGVVYGAAGASLVDAGAWITPDTAGASLAPGSERRIDFSVRVPADASTGDHVGAVVMEQAGATSATVSQIVRNVAPVRVVVPGGSNPQVMVRSAKIAALPGTSMPAVVVTMRNMGSRMCAPVLSVSMRGPSEKGSEVSRQLDMILPGDRAPYPLPWPRSIDQGSYVTKVTSSGCGATDSMTVTLDAPASFDPVSTTGAPTAGRAPNGVETEASPGESVYRDGGGKATKIPPRKTLSSQEKKRDSAFDGSVTGGASAGGGGSAGGGVGGAGAGGGAAGAAGKAAGGKGKGVADWLGDAASAVGKAAPDVIKRATIPLLLLLLVGLVFFIQEAMDRRDPKLALAPLHREPHLPFDPDPLGTGAPRPHPVQTVALVPSPNSGPSPHPGVR